MTNPSRTIAALAAGFIVTVGGGVAVEGSAGEGVGIASTLLASDDLPGDLVPAGVTDEPAFDYDQASFDASSGLAKAAQTWQAAEVVPGNPIVVVFDFRFLFPNPDAAQRYLDAAEPTLSESFTGLTLQTDTTVVGDVLRRYAGSLSQGDLTVDVQNLLFRTGPVVAKVFVLGFGTTADHALPIGQAAAGRIDAWLADQPASSSPATSEPTLSAPAGASDEPGIGTAVPYVDADGIARGQITVTDLADPFTAHHPDYPPDAGTRFVMLGMAFEAAVDQTFDADPYDILLLDTEGFLWGLGSVTQPSEGPIEELSSQSLAPGDRTSGAVPFVVPADAVIDQILYQPESGRLVGLAELVPEPEPGIGVDVPYVDADGTARGTVTVIDLADPFSEHDPSYPPDAGSRYVMLDVAFATADDQTFEADPYDILLQDADGFLWGRGSVTRPSEAAIPELDAQHLAPNNRVSGLVPFVVPADAVIDHVLYQPESGRLITLAEAAPRQE